jgi:uncharacterized membrane protein YeaQ/YmgE (transglycosylase-associated protein family)
MAVIVLAAVLISGPALEQLADRVASGLVPSIPVRTGHPSSAWDRAGPTGRAGSMCYNISGGAWHCDYRRRARFVDSGRGADQMEFVWFIVIGLVAGWLAGQVMKGGGFGALGDIVVGVIGALLGGFLFRLLGVSAGGLIGSLVVATVGAIVFLFLLRLVKRV